MFDQLSEKFANAFKYVQGKSKITEANIEETLSEVKTALLEADVHFKVTKDFINAVKEKALGEKVISGVNPSEQFIKIVHDELAKMMGEENVELNLEGAGLKIVLVVGLNGQGKTTFSGKLARHLKLKKNKEVLLVPCDTFRPAAKAQLQTLAKKIEVECFDSNLAERPEVIVSSALRFAEENNKKVVIIDTAGRLHVDEELMNDLVEVKKAIADRKPQVLMVADAMTGQAAVDVSKTFHEKVGLTGIVLSKMDSDAKGGAALSIRYVTGVPISYISMGEKMEDLELFHPDRMAKRILDMGDVVSLVEKAQDRIDQKDAESMMENFKKGKFTVNDFLKQMEMMSSLGSMASILKMIPGMGGMLRQVGDLSPVEDEMKKMKVVISSMTQAEKNDYRLIKDSRLKRIAKGSGRSEQEVQEFLNKFKQMEGMMQSLSMMMGGGMPKMPARDGFRPQKNPFDAFSGQMGGGKAGDKKNKKGPWGKSYF